MARLILYMAGKRITTIFILASILLAPYSAEARYFDSNDILTDAELFDGNALSRTAIQRFLESKGSALATVTATVAGVPKLVSEMVYEIGKEYGISQKFLLTKLQQEQGLIERSTATEKQLDWATGYSCFNNRCNEKYRGIYAQLDAAADTQRIYAQRNYFSYSVGRETKTSDGYVVKPANQATANLYIYTPYHGSLTGIGGNFFFSRIWNKYFTERVYPDGALLLDSSTGEYWKIEQNKRRKFASQSVYLADYAPENAVSVTPSQLSYYAVSDPITIANNAVVTAEGVGIMYLLSDGLKHRLVGDAALAALGYHLADTAPVTPVLIPKAELESFGEGEPITEESLYPGGILLKSDGPEIFYVKNGVKRLLLDEAVWQENFNRREPAYVSQAMLSGFTLADPVPLDEGSVVKSRDGSFYIVSNGKKKRIGGADIVSRLYGDAFLASVPTASDALLALTDLGDAIEYVDDTIPDPVNYVSYAERTGQTGQIQNQNPSGVTYLTLYDTLNVPGSMVAGTPVSASVSFRNRGMTRWKAGSVFLKLIDENSSTSSFRAENRIALAADVAPNGIATFNFEMSAPMTGGVIQEWFILEYKNEAGAIMEMPGGLVSKGIGVASGVSAQVVSHNIPVALRNKWKPLAITLKLKNTSTDHTWLSRRAAISLHGTDGAKSLFYDRADWIDAQTVGVPLNKSRIAPGEEGVVRFTLDPRNVKPGVYELVFSMELRDAGEEVYLNGRQTWTRMIRIDP